MGPPPHHHAVGQYADEPLVLSTRELPAPNGLVRECREEREKKKIFGFYGLHHLFLHANMRPFVLCERERMAKALLGQ